MLVGCDVIMVYKTPFVLAAKFLQNLVDLLHSFTHSLTLVIQNELLQMIADLIRERITNDVRASGWYGIILDETSDIRRT